ncbi:putative protein ybaS (plasmid) [Fibrella aestuarina BUZ 2]|uniref:Na+-dependent transporter n=1 Tax=Fibrella aestuarina BUZ 2 TaxID=1166018 RepID=I0KHN2_9BACT|nr:bile acid:sodium symporter [Fibrella aestuarina]CCH03635.1 putative protein ybaS [Fibrella aestuarina BUZ 2]
MKAAFHLLHQHFFKLVIASYLLAALLPGPGTWLRDVQLGTVVIFGETTRLSLSLLLLSLLLLNAGLGIAVQDLYQLLRKPQALLAGLAANLLIPLAFAFTVSNTIGRLWHSPDEVQNVLVGLAIIASMPIAASSTAWTQKNNGNLVLSLGLILLSTTLSPILTPVGLNAIGLITTGDYSEDLHLLAQSGSSGFLLISVLLPTMLGVLLHSVLGAKRVSQVRPVLKDVNLLVLLTLNYSNAASVLPSVFKNPDWDLLLIIGIITTLLCLIAFATGWWLSRKLKTSPHDRSALMFGLGMNNNGTGLVLANLALGDHPLVLLPIISYNLVQHIVAGWVDSRLQKPVE